MRICKYKFCNNYIIGRALNAKYCCDKHMQKQQALDKKNRYFIEVEKRIKEGKKKITEPEMPTIITPQASRYQDLLIYS